MFSTNYTSPFNDYGLVYQGDPHLFFSMQNISMQNILFYVLTEQE